MASSKYGVFDEEAKGKRLEGEEVIVNPPGFVILVEAGGKISNHWPDRC